MSYAICEEEKTIGFGETAIQITKDVNDVLAEFNTADYSTHEKINNLDDDLNKARSEALTDNWDNYGAKKASIYSYRHAREFALMLTGKILEIPPEIFVDPDGSLSFEWENDKTGTSIAISFGDDGSIYYSGLYKYGNKAKGKENFDGFMIPIQIYQAIIRIVDGR